MGWRRHAAALRARFWRHGMRYCACRSACAPCQTRLCLRRQRSTTGEAYCSEGGGCVSTEPRMGSWLSALGRMSLRISRRKERKRKWKGRGRSCARLGSPEWCRGYWSLA